MHKRTKVCSAVLVALSGAAALTSAPAFAQTKLDSVEITGSSIRRIDAETALPVQIIKKDEIERSGVTSTEALLQSIAAVSSQGGLNNSAGTGLSTYGQSSVSLRGLGEDRTLVLVNGRRIAVFAGGNGSSVNVNAIPLAAIERVEVLKDGASGIYGSDAIAGVVNFILTKDFRGIELGASAGSPTRGGGGQNAKAHVVAGFGDVGATGFNATVSLGLEKEKTLFARDRSYSKTGNRPPYLAAGATGQGNIQGAYTPGTGSAADGTWVEGTPQAGFGNASFGNPLAEAGQCGTINMFQTDGPNGRQICMFDSAPFVGLIPDRELVTLSANLTFKVSDSLELFGDALFSRSKITQSIQPSPLRYSFLQGLDAEFPRQGVDPVLLIRPDNPNYAIAADYLNATGGGALVGQPLGVTARVFDFGNRTQSDTSDQARVVAGLRGTVAKQDFEVALMHNENKLSGTVPDGYFSQVAFVKAVNAPGSDYNPWSLNQSDAFKQALADNQAKYTGSTLKAKTSSDSLDAKLAGDVVALPGGMAQYAAGIQARTESLTLDPSDALLSGDIAGLGGATVPMDRDRKITSFFGELNLPILKNVEGNLAVRADDYNDVGRATTYKTSLRWQPMKEIVVRGSFGTGFRAPTLVDLWYPQTLGTSEQFFDVGGAQPDTPIQVPALSGGNPDLKPEKSRQFSMGLVLSPAQNLTIGIDYFRIQVKDIIATPTVQEIVSQFRAGDSAYQDLVTLNSAGEVASVRQITTNSGTAVVSGIDIDAAYRMNVARGQLDLGLSGTYMTKFKQTSPGGQVFNKIGTIVDKDGNPVLSTNAVALDGVVLRWKHYLSATYSMGPWAFTLAQNFTKGYRDGNYFDPTDPNGERQLEHRVGSTSIYDAQVAFTGIKGLKLAVGAKNLFDKDPPLFIPTSNQFQSGYDTSMYDPRGRFVYVNASYKF